MSLAELRFREACQFYALFKRYHGPDAGLKGNRFLWMCYVDAFLTATSGERSHLAKEPAQRERRLSVHRRHAKHHRSPGGRIGGVARFHGGEGHPRPGRGHNPDRPDHEMPIFAASKIATALTNYEAQLRAQDVRTNKHTAKTTSMWDREGGNVRGALRWNAKDMEFINCRICPEWHGNSTRGIPHRTGFSSSRGIHRGSPP